MKTKSKWLLLAALLILVALLAAFALNRPPRVENFTAKVVCGDVHDVVDATGTINAVITVQVGSQVSGTIARLFADFNSRVHRGDVVALIDPALFKGALLQASADMQNATANLAAAQANLEKAKAELVQAKADYDRATGLFKDGIVSRQQLDLSKASYDSASATVGAFAASVLQAQAQVRQKTAAVDVARTNLNYTVIRSPIDGTVVARNVDVGQTVAASLQAPTIFTIAQDLTKMLVYAKTDESDVGDIKAGTEVTFKVDAFPKETFHGTVSQVRMNPTTVQNVVTYDTIVAFANPQLKLFPGMTAYVTIPIATARNVLELPNTALRYKPPMTPQAIQSAYRKYGIVDGGEQSSKNPDASSVQDAPGAPPARNPAKISKATTAVVWKLRADKTMEPVKLVLGITDHSYTEVTRVLKGELKEGDEVIVRSLVPNSQSPGEIRR